MCCRMYQFRVAPERQTNCCCEHTHTHLCCRLDQSRVAPEDRPNAAVHTHTCELQNKQVQGCTRGSRVTKVWQTNFFGEHTHVCCRKINSGLHLRVKRNKALGQLSRIWQINATVSAHTHMCVRCKLSQLKAVPKDQA